MNSQNCNNRSVRASIFGICALFTFSSTLMVFAQDYFPIGAWCFDPLDDPLLYNVILLQTSTHWCNLKGTVY